MKQPVIALKLHPGEVSIQGTHTNLKLPEGCIGICFAFESKKAARKWWGKDVPMIRIKKD